MGHGIVKVGTRDVDEATRRLTSWPPGETLHRAYPVKTDTHDIWIEQRATPTPPNRPVMTQNCRFSATNPVGGATISARSRSNSAIAT